MSFSLHRLYVPFVAAILVLSSFFAAMPTRASAAYANTPPGGKYKDCHGYMLHVSAANIRVHCIDGVPKDLSFISWPKQVNLADGTTKQTVSLKPNTPVHVIFTESLGVRHAYKIYVANPKGHGLYGFKA
jgi:hypothetical protein